MHADLHCWAASQLYTPQSPAGARPNGRASAFEFMAFPRSGCRVRPASREPSARSWDYRRNSEGLGNGKR